MIEKVTCIVQARMDSQRLPGKVLLPLGKKTVIEHVFYQLGFSKTISQCILATTQESSDDVLFSWARTNGIPVFRGKENDVLDRYYQAAKMFNATAIVRITADCPFIDPTILDEVVVEFHSGKYDYATNSMPPTFPNGIDVEVFSFLALERAWSNAMLSSEREHVTPYIRNHPELFQIANVASQKNLEHFRWTLDNQEDYQLLSIIAERLPEDLKYISMQDILKVFEVDNSLVNINKHIQRNEGYRKSLRDDQRIL
ncbi:MAG: glycosyltransferase family protein [Ignavibacteriales bacterium]|nr:glycosyltransferase family protein [Ignavibacteriales bacterium]